MFDKYLLPVIGWSVFLLPLWGGWILGRHVSKKNRAKLSIVSWLIVLLALVFLGLHLREEDPLNDKASAVFVVSLWLKSTFFIAHLVGEKYPVAGHSTVNDEKESER